MKKTAFTIIAAFLMFTASAQEKPSIKQSAAKAKISADKMYAEKISELTDASNIIKYARSKSDTLTVLDGTKFIIIKGVIYPVAAFTQSVPVFLSADAWGAVLEIINSRDYGKIPATTIGQIIQAIGQQLPRKEN